MDNITYNLYFNTCFGRFLARFFFVLSEHNTLLLIGDSNDIAQVTVLVFLSATVVDVVDVVDAVVDAVVDSVVDAVVDAFKLADLRLLTD